MIQESRGKYLFAKQMMPQNLWWACVCCWIEPKLSFHPPQHAEMECCGSSVSYPITKAWDMSSTARNRSWNWAAVAVSLKHSHKQYNTPRSECQEGRGLNWYFSLLFIGTEQQCEEANEAAPLEEMRKCAPAPHDTDTPVLWAWIQNTLERSWIQS